MVRQELRRRDNNSKAAAAAPKPSEIDDIPTKSRQLVEFAAIASSPTINEKVGSFVHTQKKNTSSFAVKVEKVEQSRKNISSNFAHNLKSNSSIARKIGNLTHNLKNSSSDAGKVGNFADSLKNSSSIAEKVGNFEVSQKKDSSILEKVGNFADSVKNNKRDVRGEKIVNHDVPPTSKRYHSRKETTKDGLELRSKHKIGDIETVSEGQNLKKNAKSSISQKETKDGREVRSKQKNIGDVEIGHVEIVNEVQNDKEKAKSSVSRTETKDERELRSIQKIGDVGTANEGQNVQEKAKIFISQKETNDGRELRSKQKIADVETVNEDQSEKEKAKKRTREQIEDNQLDTTTDLASFGSQKRGRGSTKNMSSQGGARSQVKGQIQLVRTLYPCLTMTQLSTHEGESANSPGSPSAVPSSPSTPAVPSSPPSTPAVPSSPAVPSCPAVPSISALPSTSAMPSTSAPPSTSAMPSTSSATVALPLVQGRDSRGRIIVSVSEFRQFTGGVPSPSRWFSRLLRTWKWKVCWKQFKNIDDDTKNTWWTEFQTQYTWPGYSDEEARSVFYELMTARYRAFIFDSKSKYYNEHKQPGYFPDDVWASFVAYWESEEAAVASERARRNRGSVDGFGSKHTTGSISIAEHLDRMKRVHGSEVDFSDVFASAHTTVHDPALPPKWVDARAETTFTQYRTTVEAKVAEGRLDHAGEKIPWCPQIWQEVASQGRKKRGKRVYGFGEHGARAILPSQSNVTHGSPSTAGSHLTRHATPNVASRHATPNLASRHATPKVASAAGSHLTRHATPNVASTAGSHLRRRATPNVASLESRVEQAERTNERVLAENERILAENERIRVENDRILTQMRLLMESFQLVSSTFSSPPQGCRDQQG